MLVSRLTSDVQALDEFLREAMVEVIGSGLQIALTVVVLVILSPILALVSLVALPVLIVSSWAFHHGAGGAYHAIRDRVAETLTTLQEGLSGVRVIQAFRRERQTIDAYQPRSQAQVGAWRRASFVNIRLFTMIPLAQTVALVAVLLDGLLPVPRREDQRGHDRRLRALPGAAVRPDRALQRVAGRVPPGRSRRSARSSGLLQAPNAVTERAGAVDLPADGALELRDVSFGYEAGPPRGQGRLAEARRRRARRARRRHGRGQVDAREAADAPVRPAGGLDLARRRRPARRAARVAAPPDRDAAAGGPPLQRHDRRQRAPRRPGGLGRGRAAARSSRSARASASRRCRTGSTPTCRRAASGSRPASGSWSGSRASRWPTRR